MTACVEGGHDGGNESRLEDLMRPFATQAPRVAVCAIATVMVIMAHDPATAQRAQTPAAQREQWTGTPPPGWEPYYNSEIGNVTAAQRARALLKQGPK